MRKGRTVTSSETPGNCLPSQPATAVPRPSRREQSPRRILPSPKRQISLKPSSRSPTTAPSAPAPSNTQRSPPPLAPCRGVTTAREEKKKKPARQQAPTCVSSLSKLLLQSLSPSLQLLRALVGTEAKSFLFQRRAGGGKVPFHARLQSKGSRRLGRGQTRGRFPPSDPSAGAAHILLPHC